MQQDLAVLNAVAERFCPALPSQPSESQSIARAPFHEMISQRDHTPVQTPIESVRTELGLAMNHLYTCESYIQAMNSRHRREMLRAQLEMREMDAAKLMSEITELKKKLHSLRPENKRALYLERSTLDLKTHREWLHNQITRIRSIIDMRSSTLEEQSLCCVCFERDRSVLLRPCSHLALCENCSKKVSNCPICRSRITTKINVKVS